MQNRDVSIEFHTGGTCVYQRNFARVAFEYVDTVLRDFGEPDEIILPCDIAEFDRLYSRASLIAADNEVTCGIADSDFGAAFDLRYTFDEANIGEIAFKFLEGPLLPTFAEICPKAALSAILRVDGDQLICKMIPHFAEAEIATAIVQHRARKCLNTWIAGSHEIAEITGVPMCGRMYIPIMMALHDCGHTRKEMWKFSPKALRYMWYQICTAKCRNRDNKVFQIAAITLDDSTFLRDIAGENICWDSEMCRHIHSRRMLELSRNKAGAGAYDELATLFGVMVGPYAFDELMQIFD